MVRGAAPVDGCRQACNCAIEEDQRSVFSSVYRLCLLGHVEMQQLHLSHAARHFEEAMDLAERHSGRHSIAAAMCVPMIAQLRYEQRLSPVHSANALMRT